MITKLKCLNFRSSLCSIIMINRYATDLKSSLVLWDFQSVFLRVNHQFLIIETLQP
jgi:hypothetical protein